MIDCSCLLAILVSLDLVRTFIPSYQPIDKTLNNLCITSLDFIYKVCRDAI